jgi:hypothetical protein
MSTTIETTNEVIKKKITILKKIISNANVSQNYILNDINNIENSYILGSTKLLSDYYLLLKNYKTQLKTLKDLDDNEAEQICETSIPAVPQIKSGTREANLLVKYRLEFNKKKSIFFNRYNIFIKKENFISKLDRIYNFLQKYKCIKNNSEFRKLLRKYKNDIIAGTNGNGSIYSISNLKLIEYDMCQDCKVKMKIVSSESSLLCPDCGNVKHLYGTVFEDKQFYYQEGQRTKHGSYDPSKHCKFWVEAIQARENKEIPHHIIQTVKKYIVDNRIYNINNISCFAIRKILSRTRNSKYNEHIPLIRKMITGISPPQLTDNELQLINLYFDKVIKIFNRTKPSDKINCPHHPYFIYKIIEHILKKSQPERLYNILSCIHLQSRDTLIKNDKIWKDICEEIEEITYIPTNRNLYNYPG